MLETRLAIRVRWVDAETSVIDVEGEVDRFSESALMSAYDEAARPGVRRVVLNFERLSYMNSAGIGLLVTLLIRAGRAGLRLAACCLNDHYLEILAITRLDEAIWVVPSEAEALSGD
jgi:anti-sigma B factor antagonist